MDLVFETHQIDDTQKASKSALFEIKRYLFSQPGLADEIFVVGRARVPVLNMISHARNGSPESFICFYLSLRASALLT